MKSQPENPPLKILGRVGDEQYSVDHIDFSLQACQSHTEKSECSLPSFEFLQPTSNYKGS